MFKKNRRGLIPFLLSSVLSGTIALLLINPGTAQGQDGCSCTNCPQFMPDNFQGNFYIQVENAVNPILGQNGQGVCGVTMDFSHEYLGDLTITLTSPAGQTVTLIGPPGLFGETDGTNWTVTFVPCSDPADPDPGFADTWSNNQNWGLFGMYTGSYYPFTGCLEDFNDGPVNGQWTLTVTDGQFNDVGSFNDYSIIFCDPAGIECISCEANAGNLVQNDISACTGSPDLILDLPPTYALPQTPPPANTYAYTYIIALGGVIIAYDSIPDLSTYTPGTYTVCGLSYLRSDSLDIPPPNGMLTISQLSAQLNSSTPPFCGKTTSNCVNVNILPIPPDVDDYETICAPGCFEYHDSVFCASGDYPVSDTLNGCAYTATLHLTVLQPPSDTLFETICAGTCAQTPGYESFCNSGNYTLKYPGSAGCDSFVTLRLNVLNVIARIDTPPPIFCGQSSVELIGDSSSTGPGVNYSWTASAGGNILGPADQLQALAGSAGTYTLEVCKTEAGIVCCDTAVMTVQANTDPPEAPGMIFGPVQVCPGQIQEWYITPDANVENYSWAIPPNVTVLAGQDSSSITLHWENYNSDSICVRATNACGMSAPTCLLISTIDTLPAPSIPSGDTLVCFGDTLLYTASGLPSMNTFYWELPTEVTTLSGQGTDSLVLIWNLDTIDSVCVYAFNDCDTSIGTCLPVKTIQPLSISKVQGPDTVCAGSITSYQIVPPTGTATYLWEATGGVINSNTNGAEVEVQWFNQASTGNICVQVINACGIATSQCVDVVIQDIPKVFAGKDTAVCGLSIDLNAVLINTNTTSIYWEAINGPGPALFADKVDPKTSVQITIPGLYRFRWTEENAYCSQSDTVRVQFNPLPAVQAEEAVCNGTNDFYTITASLTGGTAPFWVNGTLVSGATFSSGLIPSGDSYSYSFTDANGCMVSLAGEFDCACTTSAGQMESSILLACVGQTVTANSLGGVSLDANDTVLYVLHTNMGSVLGQVLDQNTSGVFGWLPGMELDSTYYISLVAGNKQNGLPDPADPCYSVSEGQPVIFSKPPEPVAGDYKAFCGLSGSLSAIQSDYPGTWSVEGSPGVVMFTAIDSAKSLVQVSQPGLYSFKWMEHTGVCTAFDTVSIEFLEIPHINDLEAICTGLNTTYTLQFKISGGLPPYFIDGLAGAMNADFFLSTLLPGDSYYTFSITDSNGCVSDEFSGTQNCMCVTSAGSMDTKTRVFCLDQLAVAPYNQDGKLDPDDMLQFILHDLPGDSIGNIYAISDQPVFPFNPAFQPGQAYFISAIAGSNLGGAVDLNDPCLSVTPGTPVSWLPLPNANILGDTTICAGGQARLQFQATGVFPVTITYSDEKGQVFNVEIHSNAGLDVYVAPQITTTYNLIEAKDASPSACTKVLGDSVTVTVQDNVFAGIADSTAGYCTGTDALVMLSELLFGEQNGGAWLETSDNPSSNNGFDPVNGTFQIQDQAPGVYTFMYRVTGQGLCPDDSATVNILVHTNPIADAGSDLNLDCFTPFDTIGGLGTSIGPGLTYTWFRIGSNQPLGSDFLLNVDRPGSYILTVNDSLGCSATDSVKVVQLSIPITVAPVRVNHILCHGEQNGSVVIDSVSGGTPPVLFSLNGQPFQNTAAFERLAAGQYILMAQDVEGCEWVDTFEVYEPPSIKIELGPDIEAALGDSVYLWLQSSLPQTALDTIIWLPLFDTLNAGTFYQRFLPLRSAKIAATVVDSNGCAAQDAVILQVDRTRRIYIPNVFSPEGNTERLFTVSFGADVALIESMEIYDRWGELVHQARKCTPGDKNLTWNGYFKGKPAPAGVYSIYLVIRFVDGEQEVFAGNLTLLR